MSTTTAGFFTTAPRIPEPDVDELPYTLERAIADLVAKARTVGRSEGPADLVHEEVQDRAFARELSAQADLRREIRELVNRTARQYWRLLPPVAD